MTRNFKSPNDNSSVISKSDWVVKRRREDKALKESITTHEQSVKFDEYLSKLWEANPAIYEILRTADDIEDARSKLYLYLFEIEHELLENGLNLHELEHSIVRQSLQIFKNIISSKSEKASRFSSLLALYNLARNEALEERIEVAFLAEFLRLFRAVKGEIDIYDENEFPDFIPSYLKKKGREAAIERMKILDDIGNDISKKFIQYPSGLEVDIIQRRKENKERIKAYFNVSEEDWNDYKWQLKNVIKTVDPLVDLIDIPDDIVLAIRKSSEHGVPFGITPYYLSLMDKSDKDGFDHAVRAMVLPPLNYVETMIQNNSNRDMACDFMGEHDTSPVDLITRRYPMISIIKPFNTCAQICVYCQRNWEIEECMSPDAMASQQSVDEAIKWVDEHEAVGDLLVTGGDPLVMKDNQLRKILDHIKTKKQIYRVRFGSRTPVVLPQRWTDDLINLLKEYHNPPELEIAIVTHFEHSYEITPEAAEAVKKIRQAGLSCYNQAVFTVENSRRYELVKLRRDLKSIGIDPYYTFNMKGKKETFYYMVPIARLLQERKEEARLLPGLDRTDEPVFNVPRMGKNHLRAGQDHKVIMIKPNGSRVYEFHPWEKNLQPVPPYYYTDVPIYGYLKELKRRGEDLKEYKNIWYYF